MQLIKPNYVMMIMTSNIEQVLHRVTRSRVSLDLCKSRDCVMEAWMQQLTPFVQPHGNANAYMYKCCNGRSCMYCKGQSVSSIQMICLHTTYFYHAHHHSRAQMYGYAVCEAGWSTEQSCVATLLLGARKSCRSPSPQLLYFCVTVVCADLKYAVHVWHHLRN